MTRGFVVGNPSIGKAPGPGGAFLTLDANLDPSAMMRQLAANNRFMAEAVEQITTSMTPALAKKGGALPPITIDVVVSLLTLVGLRRRRVTVAAA